MSVDLTPGEYSLTVQDEERLERVVPFAAYRKQI